MEISNKEVLEKLTAYLMQQDHESLATALAGCMIDYNRLYTFHLLERDEKCMLADRIQANAVMLGEFVEKGFPMDEPFKAVRINSEEIRDELAEFIKTHTKQRDVKWE